MAEPPAEPAAKKPCVKPGGKSMSSSKTKKKGGIWEHYEETTETGQRGGPQVKCTHCKANMNPNVTTIMTPHTATCSAAPSEVRKRFGGTGTVAERDHPAPSAGDHGAAAKGPPQRVGGTIAGRAEKILSLNNSLKDLCKKVGNLYGFRRQTEDPQNPAKF